MAKRLTPEERLQRDAARKAAKIAEREAQYAARAAQWAAEKQQQRDAFQAALTEVEKLAIATILKPTGTKFDPYTEKEIPVYSSEFIESLASQIQSRGCLSPTQMKIVVTQYQRAQMVEKAVADWPAIAEGDRVEFMAKIVSIEVGQGDFGPFRKIKMKSHYGRCFNLKTNSQKFVDTAMKAKEADEPVCVDGTIRWVSPDGFIGVLKPVGLKFEGLIQ